MALKFSSAPWLIEYLPAQTIPTPTSIGPIHADYAQGLAFLSVSEADAALAAAAPTMYAALEALVAAYDAHTDGFARQVLRAHAEAASAALSLARGEHDE